MVIIKEAKYREKLQWNSAFGLFRISNEINVAHTEFCCL